MVLTSAIFSQNKSSKILDIYNETIDVNKKRYITSETGEIMINVNIWGHVNAPGIQTVPDGTDFVSLFSYIGGPLDGANLSKIKLYRHLPDGNGNSIYSVNLNSFIKNGDRSSFFKIKPNDTIIVKKKRLYFLIEQLNMLNSVIGITTIIIQLFNIFN
jgi:hypothetical protein